MNNPSKRVNVDDFAKYVKDLENYIELFEQRSEIQATQIQRLTRALDKACELLEFHDRSCYCVQWKSKLEYKEWLLEDD